MGDKGEISRGSCSLYDLFSKRQFDFSEHVHSFYKVRTRLYGTMNFLNSSHKCQPQFKSLDDQESLYGSIFNLEFCPEDDSAYAVSSNKVVLIFDPRIHSPLCKPSHVLSAVHADCVNCITFLEGNVFATSSDDKTIKIWDRRNMYVHMAHLRGHTNWVKNIEYDPKSNLLFSIAFRDGVRSWDMNRLEFYNENSGVKDNLVFKLKDPVRMRLSPDYSKMFVSMKENTCLVVDRFEGSTIHEAGEHINELLKNPASVPLHDCIRHRLRNRPSLHVMSYAKNREHFRSVMSADFHPSSEFIALRHIDVRNDAVHLELTTLYDLRHNYSPYLPPSVTKDNYTRYVDEWSSDEALDYIKEISFSKDGRVLASPFDSGIRLFAVDSSSTPMDLYFDERFHSEDKSLNSLNFDVIQTSLGHSSPVLTCKFAHHDLLLGSGCLKGQVAFHKPIV